MGETVLELSDLVRELLRAGNLKTAGEIIKDNMSILTTFDIQYLIDNDLLDYATAHRDEVYDFLRIVGEECLIPVLDFDIVAEKLVDGTDHSLSWAVKICQNYSSYVSYEAAAYVFDEHIDRLIRVESYAVAAEFIKEYHSDICEGKLEITLQDILKEENPYEKDLIKVYEAVAVHFPNIEFDFAIANPDGDLSEGPDNYRFCMQFRNNITGYILLEAAKEAALHHIYQGDFSAAAEIINREKDTCEGVEKAIFMAIIKGELDEEDFRATVKGLFNYFTQKKEFDTAKKLAQSNPDYI